MTPCYVNQRSLKLILNLPKKSCNQVFQVMSDFIKQIWWLGHFIDHIFVRLATPKHHIVDFADDLYLLFRAVKISHSDLHVTKTIQYSFITIRLKNIYIY